MMSYGKLIGVSNLEGQPYYEIYWNTMVNGSDEYHLVYLNENDKVEKVVRLFCGCVMFN